MCLEAGVRRCASLLRLFAYIAAAFVDQALLMAAFVMVVSVMGAGSALNG